jgi:type IV secretory pathway VirB2 component (pilin)
MQKRRCLVTTKVVKAVHSSLSSTLNRWPLLLVALSSATPIYAQGSPWEQAVSVMTGAFIGPIAKGLSLVAIVVGGLMFAFGEGESKRMLAGIVFGVGMAVGATAFLTWLFGG